ncbi:MAG: PAS domain-containing protein [Desulfobacteraceae bacterium]|nr:MAG: PAS domain-containing protein [Desulfobacteraceae bacterium]
MIYQKVKTSIYYFNSEIESKKNYKTGANQSLPSETTMRRVCAWCQKELNPSESIAADQDVPITHGICKECYSKLIPCKAKTLKSFLDQFTDPVFLVDSEGRVVTSNSAAISALGKKPEEIDGYLGGDVFDCKYAGLPGGCGNTIHCKSCTIRNTVSATLQSGKSHVRVPAYPDLYHITCENKVRFLITTERVGNTVLLRIDEIAEENGSC